MAKSQTYYHTIDAKIATNIGEDSISDPVQAVLELAKNKLLGAEIAAASPTS